MSKPETDMAIPVLNDMLIAFSLLTRLPVPHADWSNEARPPARAAWAYPLVGLVVGGLGAGVAWAALWMGVPPVVAAMLLLLTTIMCTGAMHEDGLADCADGFWGGWERARRLEIMKDSLIGTYGVLALVMSVGTRWMIYTGLLAHGGWALIAPAILSRVAMVCVMQALPNARDSGLSASTGRPGWACATGAVLIGLITLVGLPIGIGLCVIATVGLTATALALIARAKIGGQTGDVLGATQQVTEIAALIALSTAL